MNSPFLTRVADKQAEIRDAILSAVPGEKRKPKDDLKHGFRVLSDGKQIASAYFGDNALGNQVEFALNFRLFEEDSGMHEKVKRWLDYQKVLFGNRAVNVHQRGVPVDWFRIGFELIEPALHFLQKLRSERRLFDPAARWQIADCGQTPDTIAHHSVEPTGDITAERNSKTKTAPHSQWNQAAVRMVTTAEHTIAQSNGNPVQRNGKDKQSGFGSTEEFEHYVLGLIDTQGACCAISGLSLQRDEACSDTEMLASLDRIDSSGHYAPGNLQVVCRFINRWKGADDNKLFVRLIAELRRHIC